MRILQVNTVYGISSTGMIVEYLHNLALNSGMDSYVAYSTTNKKNIINGYKIGTFFEKKIHAVLCRIGGKQAYFSTLSTYLFIRYIKKIKPDIIHLHNLHSNYINLNVFLNFLSKSNIKTVITLHDCWFYTGGCFHYTAINCNKWKAGCGNCPKKMQDTKAYFKDNSAKILKDRKKYLSKIKHLTIVGVSDWITKEVRHSFLKDKNIITIHNGVDIHYFKETASEFRKINNLENKFIILGLASKWLSDINKETFKYISENLQDDEVLLLIGCKKSQIKKLPASVRGLSYIDDMDYIRKIFSACDVFANCTKEEAFCLVNLECQSCGTPMVVFDNSGTRETVGKNTGIVVENGNYKEFLSAIRKIKKSGKEYYKKNCRKWIKENFEKEKNYSQFLSLYNSNIESEK